MRIYDKPGSEFRLFEMMENVNKLPMKEALEADYDLPRFLRAIEKLRRLGQKNRKKQLSNTFFRDFIGKDFNGIKIVSVDTDFSDGSHYLGVTVELENGQEIHYQGANYDDWRLPPDPVGYNEDNKDLRDGKMPISRADARLLSKISLKINPNTKYKTGTGDFNIKNYENMDLNEQEITPEVNEIINMSLEKLRAGALKVEKGGTNKSVLQSVNDVSYVSISGYDSAKNMYNFNFKIIGNEGDQEGVFNLDDVILEKFYYKNPQGDIVIDLDAHDLTDFNNAHDANLYDIVEEYIDMDTQPGEEIDEIQENMEKKLDSQPFGGSKEEFQDGMGYGDEKPVNPKLRVKAPELEKFVKEERVDPNVAKIQIGSEPWYIKKAGDSTHFYLSNNPESLSTNGSWVYHIGEFREKPFYDDVRVWLRGGDSPDGKQYDDVETVQEEKSNKGGENKIKNNYNTLLRDLDFNKLAKAYESLLKIKRDDFRGSSEMQGALSSVRNSITEYLNKVKGLDVDNEEVQNYFEQTLTKFSTVFEEEEKTAEPSNEVPSCDIKDIDNDGDVLKGGEADNADVADYNPNQVLTGMEVELEHTDDPRIALEIAMDHLEELPDYYTRLDKMEKEGEAAKAAEDSGMPGIDTAPVNKESIEGIEGKPEMPQNDDERNLLMGWEEEKQKDKDFENQLLGIDINTPNASEDIDFAAQEREYEDNDAYKRFQELNSKDLNTMGDEEKEEFYNLWIEFGKEYNNE